MQWIQDLQESLPEDVVLAEKEQYHRKCLAKWSRFVFNDVNWAKNYKIQLADAYVEHV